ncbi:hypothetical protein F4778DRAFT_642662 [Xylariomycetidae sp. FL2044]|nr:hypothetical protein F4778DRAFT_642662 [Xylariomycetidae sp. FL2044]
MPPTLALFSIPIHFLFTSCLLPLHFHLQIYGCTGSFILPSVADEMTTPPWPSLARRENTTTTSVCTSPTNSINPHNGTHVVYRGVTKGSAAGIGIGCTIAGGLIALLGLFLFRRNRPKAPQSLTTLTALTKPSPFEELPQAIGHSELRSEMDELCAAVKNYVDNFFHDTPASSPTLSERDLISVVGSPQGPQDAAWKPLLVDLKTRNVTARTYVARVVFSRLDARGDSSTTLLPLNVFNCYKETFSRRETQKAASLRGLWRSVTSFLLFDDVHQARIPLNDARIERVNKAVDDISGVLGPLLGPKTQHRASQVLESVLKDAAIFGLKVFSQADSLEFDWGSGSGGSNVVFPGLKQRVSTPSLGNGQVTTILAPKLR